MECYDNSYWINDVVVFLVEPLPALGNITLVFRVLCDCLYNGWECVLYIDEGDLKNY